MVKPTVFSVDQDPKKNKQTDVHLITVKEVAPYKTGFDDEEPLIAANSQVCTLQRCACALIIILVGLACVIGAGIGLYLHLSERNEPTLIVAEGGHPYGNDALYPPDFYRPPVRVGGYFEKEMPDFHHGSRNHLFERFRPRPPFPGRYPNIRIGVDAPPPPPVPDHRPHFPGNHPPPYAPGPPAPPPNEGAFAHDAIEPPFGHDAIEPPFVHDAIEPPVVKGGSPRKELHERPQGPPGPYGPYGRKHKEGGPMRERGPGPHPDRHHGSREPMRVKEHRPSHHGDRMP
ncbi:uncharacterized protein [Diadema antillarum]|uniref:uncharacterized protein n=1 Tax=Diadema antillarum TaxID=105358 RepID=UPI003A882931